MDQISRRLVTVLLASIVLIGASSAAAQSLLDQSPPNVAAGEATFWDLTTTDCTFKESLGQLWVLDAHSEDTPVIVTFSASDLQAPSGTIPLDLPAELDDANARVLGIAEIAAGSLEGQNLLVADLNFELVGTEADSRIAVYDDAGELSVDFTAVPNLPLGTRLSSIAAHPSREEFVAYDLTNHQIYHFDFAFVVLAGPIDLVGLASMFTRRWQMPREGLGGQFRFEERLHGTGVGIVFNGDDTVLVTESLNSVFRVDTAFEYELSEGEFTGQVFDLTAAASSDDDELLFTSLARGTHSGENALFGINLADEAIYAFDIDLTAAFEPVTFTACELTSGEEYQLEWMLPQDLDNDSIVVVENGVQVATLPQNSVSYSAPTAISGKTIVEVATVLGGERNRLHRSCEFENAPQLSFSLPGLNTEIVSLPRNRYADVASTKLPDTVDDFLLYLFIHPGGEEDDAFVSVHDYTGTAVDTFQLRAPRPSNLDGFSVGIALTPIDDLSHLAVLDPDGFENDGVPGAAFFPLADDMGQITADREIASLLVEIDLSGLPEPVSLTSWDFSQDEYFVALGTTDVGGMIEPRIVRLDFDGASITATRSSPIPQRLLTPFGPESSSPRPVLASGITVLPSGNLFIAGAHTFSTNVSEALLTTPPEGDDGVQFVGFAQGLIQRGQFFRGAGSGFGAPTSLEVAFFTSEGVGATYLASAPTSVIENGAANDRIELSPAILFTANSVSHPDLEIEQLAIDDVVTLPTTLQSTGKRSRTILTELTEYSLTVVNLSETDSLPLDVIVLLDDVEDTDFSRSLVMAPGRFYRLRMPDRSESSIEVRFLNQSENAASIRYILGATGVRPVGSPFHRGDCNGEGIVDISDAIFGLQALFAGGDQPSCVDACDTDDNAQWDISDMISILNFLFAANSPAPAPPGPDNCGVDPTDDSSTVCVDTSCS